MPVVRISAKVIRWPDCCACCCGNSDATVNVSHVRTKGIKVVRAEQKSWDVPYCRNCLQHMQMEQSLADARHQVDQLTNGWGYPARPRPEPDTVMVLSIIVVAFSSVLFYIVPLIFMALRINPLVAGFLALVIGGPFIAGTIWLCLQWHRAEQPKRAARAKAAESRYQAEVAEYQQRLRAAKDRLQKVERARERLLRPGCAFLGLAVEYQGWHGTVHTFFFVNDRFAEAFADANPGKIVDGQMG